MSLFRKLFGPSLDDVWRTFAAGMNGTFVPGGFWKSSKVLVPYRHWTITLDTYLLSGGRRRVPYTRLRAVYVDLDQFRFSLCRKGLLSNLAIWFGAQAVAIGHEEFDRQFVLKGSSNDQLQRLFSDPHLRELVETMSHFQLMAQRSEPLFGARLPVGLAELQFVTLGLVKDLVQLEYFVDLMRATLDQLCSLGSAAEIDPQFRF